MTPSSDQPRSPRRPLEVPVAVRVITGSLTGLSDNLSGVGILLTSEEPFRVEVELDVDGKRLIRTGRLIRLDRVDAENCGIAIEFDD